MPIITSIYCVGSGWMECPKMLPLRKDTKNGRTEGKKGLLYQNQESDSEKQKCSLKCTSPEHSTSFSCTFMFFTEIRLWLY